MFENFKCTDVLLVGGALVLAPVFVLVALPALPVVALYHAMTSKP